MAKNVLSAGISSLKRNGGTKAPKKETAGKKGKEKEKKPSTPPNDGEKKAPERKAETKPTSSAQVKTTFSTEEQLAIRKYIGSPEFPWAVINAIDGLGMTDELRDVLTLLASKDAGACEVVSTEQWSLKYRAYGKNSKKWYPASKEETYWDDGNEDAFTLKWIWVSSKGYERDATADEVKEQEEKLRKEKIEAARKRKADSSAAAAAS